MEEDEKNTEWTHIAYTEQVNLKDTTAERSVVGQLLAYNLTWHIPAYEETGKQSTRRQQYLSGEEVEPVEQRLIANDEPVARVTERQRAEDANESTEDGDKCRTLVARDLQFLVEEGR